jgi:hypothetical protein
MEFGSLNAAQAVSIKLIPFNTRIPEEKQDRQLEEKLRGEASGILNWLLEGAKRWTEERLKTPQIITSAPDEYRGRWTLSVTLSGNGVSRNRGQALGQGNCSRCHIPLPRVFGSWGSIA